MAPQRKVRVPPPEIDSPKRTRSPSLNRQLDLSVHTTLDGGYQIHIIARGVRLNRPAADCSPATTCIPAPSLSAKSVEAKLVSSYAVESCPGG